MDEKTMNVYSFWICKLYVSLIVDYYLQQVQSHPDLREDEVR